MYRAISVPALQGILSFQQGGVDDAELPPLAHRCDESDQKTDTTGAVTALEAERRERQEESLGEVPEWLDEIRDGTPHGNNRQ